MMNKAPAESPLIQLDQVSKQFVEGGQVRTVLADLTARFYAGEFAAILGPSGSGKSTLLNLISGIDMPSRGDIIVADAHLSRLSDHDRTLFRRDNIGFVFQFFNLIPTLTVLENVTLPQELAGRSPRALRQPAMELLDLVGLADRHQTFPDRLSGGEQQRVAIARALAHDPMLVLADEPTGNLDQETGRRVLQLLLDLTRQVGKTLLMATHSLDIAPLADRVLQVTDRRLVEATAQIAPPSSNGATRPLAPEVAGDQSGQGATPEPGGP